MSLSRIYEKLGSVLINRFNQAAGPRSDRVDQELDNLVSFINAQLFKTYHTDVTVYNTGANTTETNFTVKTIDANEFANNGDFMIIAVRGTDGSNSNGKRFRFYWDSTVFFDTTSIPSAGTHFFFGFIMRRTSSELITVLFHTYFNNVAVVFQAAPANGVVTTIDFTQSHTFKTTAQNAVATAGDINQTGLLILKGNA
jgi:hypothetical protein